MSTPFASAREAHSRELYPRKSNQQTDGNRTEWHRVYAWRNLSKFAKILQKGQLITLKDFAVS